MVTDHHTGQPAMHFSIIEGHSQDLNGDRLCDIRFCGVALNMASDLWGCPVVLKGVFKGDTPTKSGAQVSVERSPRLVRLLPIFEDLV